MDIVTLAVEQKIIFNISYCYILDWLWYFTVRKGYKWAYLENAEIMGVRICEFVIVSTYLKGLSVKGRLRDILLHNIRA